MMNALSADTLALIFALIMGLSLFVYAILDGYDLGVGILAFFLSEEEKEPALDSIGPFWDANETWLVLGVGILLVAFPKAHGEILGHLYLPVSIMLLGLILRGVSYELRKKVPKEQKHLWTALFALGSLVTSSCQGFMLGLYLTGFRHDNMSLFFSVLTSLSLMLAYVGMGASWLLMRSPLEHFAKILKLARINLFLFAGSVLLVAIAKPLIVQGTLDIVQGPEQLLALAPFPLLTCFFMVLHGVALYSKNFHESGFVWLPLVLLIGVMGLLSHGIILNLYPYVIPGQLSLKNAMAAPESLVIILGGILIVLPLQIIYTIFIYRIFHGRAKLTRVLSSADIYPEKFPGT